MTICKCMQQFLRSQTACGMRALWGEARGNAACAGARRENRRHSNCTAAGERSLLAALLGCLSGRRGSDARIGVRGWSSSSSSSSGSSSSSRRFMGAMNISTYNSKKLRAVRVHAAATRAMPNPSIRRKKNTLCTNRSQQPR